VLKGLNDCAFNLELFDRFIDEQVMLESLLRDISDDNVRNRYHRLAMGDARLTEFWFEYAFSPTEANTASPVLTFHVVPHSEPPTNIHVLIGRNGAGKTRCLQHLARAILTTDPIWGQIRQLGSDWNKWEFAGLVFVSFSAFDQFDFPESKRRDMRASLVSLRPSTPERETTKTPMELARDFYESFLNCSEGLKAIRWAEAIKTLENDPLFAEAEVGSLLNVAKRDLLSQTISLFSALSSGHAIVLLTITQLVDLVDERTLVLLEEPEGHLHPPLLSAFIRAVADLLIKRNGVAIVATHSPVVLQEVPKTCVTVLRRTGNFAVAEQPTIETFGENVGVLTHAVFGLEVTTAGFHQILRRLVEDELLNYEEVRERFAGQLGAEARTIVRALISERDSQ
jgi:ABC-type cobalamin/Fe3+-siderophores transport system ATPase subunit